SFVVSLARFHRSDPDLYVLQGYFETNTPEDSRILAYLDGKEVPVRMGVREGLGIRQKYFSRGIGYENIDREYDLWIGLPKDWKRGLLLKVFQSYDGRKTCIYRVSVQRLKKEQRMADGYLETFRIQDGKVFIGGWAVADEPCRFLVRDERGNRLPCTATRHYRQDIVDSYPEARDEDADCFGYEVSFDRPEGARITLSVGSPNRQLHYRLNLKKGIGNGTIRLSPLKKTAAYFKRHGFARTVRRAGQKIHERFTGQREGYMSWRTHVQPSKEELEEQRGQTFPIQPLISIAVPMYRTDEKLLQALVDSVRAQTYGNWELCLSDGSGADSPLTGFLKKLEASDERIRVIDTRTALGISDNTNQALSIARGDYVAFADHDDLLPPWSLYECVREINEHPDLEMIYSDEDKVTMDGRSYFQPHFKSDFNMDLLTSMNYFCHLVVVKRSLMEKAGQFDASFDGAQDYDFVLRCVEASGCADRIRHIPKVLYHWRSHPDSTSENPESKRYAF
ncbi:MAG: glycosyltransferase, partial [Lachnospiraceae bacterium]|nr:glycosyltransferase [Lachnospiraceae bacterium]